MAENETWHEWAVRALPSMYRDFEAVAAETGLPIESLLSLAIYAALNTTMAAMRSRPDLAAKMERLADLSLKEFDEEKPWGGQ